MSDSASSWLSDDLQAMVWADDAPQYWQMLSEKPPLRHDDTVFVCSGAAVMTALQNAAVFSSGPKANFLGSETGLIPLQIDPPKHVEYRKMLDLLFAPRQVARLADDITGLANTCIDGFIDRGTCDFSTEFAVPYPTATFLRLLGLPFSQLHEFLQLKDDIIRPDGSTVEETTAVRTVAGRAINTIFDRALTQSQREPGEDILGYLVGLEADGRLERQESVNICFLLFLAGLDTVTGTLEASFAMLARQPDLRRALVDDAALIPSAVEELLRWSVNSPVQSRIATEDFDLHGCPIAKGDKVKLVNGVVNFDPVQIADPLVVDLGREQNRHASFGLGVHRCLGSHLARLELRIAVAEWHRRIPDYRLADDRPIAYSQMLREIRHLPMVFSAAG
jgi:cytochrome P450